MIGFCRGLTSLRDGTNTGTVNRCVESIDRMNHFSYLCARVETREGFFAVSGEFRDRRNSFSLERRGISTGVGEVVVSADTVRVSVLGVASLSVFTEGESV